MDKMEQVLSKIKRWWETVKKKAENPPKLFFIPAGSSILAVGNIQNGDIELYENNKIKEKISGSKRKRKQTPQGVR